MAEQGLDLRGVGAALAESGGVGVAEPVGAKAGDPGGCADGEDDLGDAGNGQPAALASPQWAWVVAAFGDPGRQALSRHRGQRDVADFVALAVQADAAGARGDRDVVEVEAFAFLDAGAVMIAAFRAPRRSAARSTLPRSAGLSASGSPGRETRARLMLIRSCGPCS